MAEINAVNTIPDYPRGVTFEEVWAAIKEDRLKNEERRIQWEKEREEDNKKREEDNRKEEEQRRKWEMEREEHKASMEELRRIVRQNKKQMGEIHNRFGQLAEHLVAPNIHKRFNELGYHYEFVSTKGCKIYDPSTGNILAEIDIVLENSKNIMAVEVKVKPALKDIEPHIERLQLLRNTRDMLNDKRKVLGAIAGAIFGIEEKKAVISAGLFVIEQTGDTMKISVPEGFKPREW